MDIPYAARTSDDDLYIVDQRARRLVVDSRVRGDDYIAGSDHRLCHESLNHGLRVCLMGSLTLETSDFLAAAIRYAKGTLKIPSYAPQR